MRSTLLRHASLSAVFALAIPGCAVTVVAGSDGTTGTAGAGGNDPCANGCEHFGVSSTSTSTGGGVSCSDAHGHVSIALSVDGQIVGPKPEAPKEIDIQGRIQATTDGTIKVDPCDPNANCTAGLAVLKVDELGFTPPTIPEGTFVRLHYYAAIPVSFDATPAGAAQHVLVQNLPTLNGVVNPTASSERVWLAAESQTDGARLTLPANLDPFEVTSSATCAPGPDIRAGFVFQFPQQSAVTVFPGAQDTLDVSGTFEGHYTFATMQNTSLDTGVTDGYWITGS